MLIVRGMAAVREEGLLSERRMKAGEKMEKFLDKNKILQKSHTYEKGVWQYEREKQKSCEADGRRRI